MIQRDFIKRQLEELGRAIAKVISDMQKLKVAGNVNDGIRLAQETLKSTFDLDMENLQSLPIDKFTETLITEKNLSIVHLNYLGNLLCATAEMFDQKKDTAKAKKLYQKALAIFHYVDHNERTFSVERNNKIEAIESYLGIIN